ncbi:hypothetical protein JCM6882_007539 [Rhodosporidiobolus microsporus]
MSSSQQLPATSRTVVISQPFKGDSFDNLVFEDRPLSAPKGTEVVIRVKAISLNARDCQIASGTYPALKDLADGLVAGSDAAGDVIAVGENVTRFKVGDRVSPIFSQSFIAGDYHDQQATALGGGIDGCLTEYFKCDQEGLVAIPEHLTYAQACTSTITGVTSWHCLYGHPGATLQAGETVLVLGTGGVSIYAAQIALAAGAKIICTSSSDEKLARIRKEVSKEIQTVNYSKIEQWDEEVKKLTGGRGVDHVIEIGGAATLPKSVRSCRVGGNVWVVGYLSIFQDKDAKEEMANLAVEILISQVGVKGVIVGSREHYEALNRAVEASKIVPIVDQVFPFEQTKEAYRVANKGAFGKIVIELA